MISSLFVIRVTAPSGRSLLKRGSIVQTFDSEAEARKVAKRKNTHPNAALLKFSFEVERAIACAHSTCSNAVEKEGERCAWHRDDSAYAPAAGGKE